MSCRTAQRRLIRLGGCQGWSESSLGALITLLFWSCGSSNAEWTWNTHLICFCDILIVLFSSKASTSLTFWLLFSVPKHLRHWHFECWFQFQSIYVTDILIQFQSIYITDILIVVFSCKASTSSIFWVLVSVPKHLRHWHFDCCFQYQSINVTDIFSVGFSSKASTSLTFWLLFSVPKHLRHCCYLSWNRVHCNLVRPKKISKKVSGFPTLPMFLAWP